MKWRWLLVISGLVLGGTAEAAPTELRAIVLTGTKLPARASGQLDAIRAKLGGFSVAPGFPKVVESKSLPGLKPGFEVILLGLCPTVGVEGSLTELVERAAKDVVPGSYSRVVKFDGPAACPSLKIARPDDAEGQALYSVYEVPRRPQRPGRLGPLLGRRR